MHNLLNVIFQRCTFCNRRNVISQLQLKNYYVHVWNRALYRDDSKFYSLYIYDRHFGLKLLDYLEHKTYYLKLSWFKSKDILLLILKTIIYLFGMLPSNLTESTSWGMSYDANVISLYVCNHVCISTILVCGIYSDNNNKWKESITDTLLPNTIAFFVARSKGVITSTRWFIFHTLCKDWKVKTL